MKSNLNHFFIFFGALASLAGVVARSLSSHAIQPFLLERNKLDNFNLGADYLLFHGLALIAVAVLGHLHPEARYHYAGWAFIGGTILFQGTVLLKSCIAIHPFGFLTPIGGFMLMGGWLIIILCSVIQFWKMS